MFPLHLVVISKLPCRPVFIWDGGCQGGDGSVTGVGVLCTTDLHHPRQLPAKTLAPV